MRSFSLVGLVAVSLSLAVGCAATPSGEEGADTATGAASATANKITSGIYDFDLQLVVQGTQVQGSYFSQVGDPEHGGAQCYFTVAGFIENIGGVDHAHLTAVDGYGVTGAELVAQPNGSVKFSTVNGMSACMRTSPMLSEGGFVADKTGALPAGIAGFRTVQAEKSFFYDRAGGTPRAAYVTSSDTVTVTGPEQNGFLPVSYTGWKGGSPTTKGFLKTADLAALHSPVARDTLRGKFVVEPNDGIDASFEVVTSDNRDMFFNLGSINKFGGQNMGDIEQGHAPIVGDTATWQGDGCKVVFAFASDAKSVKVTQNGQCSDFGANVDVSGTYRR